MATKKEADGNHPSSHYLVVEDASKPSTWHLRMRDVGGKVNHTLMGAAWAALHGGYRGNKYAGPNKAQALAKLRKLYASEGLTPPGEKMLAFFKDKKNSMWFIGVYSNNYEDRQKDIMSEASHQEYARWIQKTGVKPPIVLLHQPHFPGIVHFAMLLGLATGKMSVDEYNNSLMELYQSTAVAQTKTVLVKNGFAFVIGKVLESKRGLAEKLMKSQNTWGMSHGFIPLTNSDNIINQYRTFEFTLAPESLLANEITAISFKEDKMEVLKELTEEERQVIQQVFDEEDAETATNKAREILRSLLASKMEVEPEKTETEETPSEETTDEYMTLVTKLAEDFKFAELSAVIKTVGERLAALEQSQVEVQKTLVAVNRSEDERVADQIIKGIDWTLGHGTKLDEKPTEDEQELVEKLKGDMPDQIVESTEKADPKNPLQAMFWEPLLRS